MRVLRTTKELHERGWTRDQIRRGERRGQWRLIIKGVYGEGSGAASDLDIARATALLVCGVAAGNFAGVLRGLDSVHLERDPEILVPLGSSNRRPGVRRVKTLPPWVEVAQVRCTDGPTTMLDLARRLDDITFEQALESALRMRLVGPSDVEQMMRGATRAEARVRRVVRARGGLGVVPTESLLETLMVQLIRTIPGAPPPERQVNVYDEHGNLVARVDLAWPSLGIFIELDGQQHLGQPLYDASRQTAVVAITGWLVGRFTWYEVNFAPAACRRRLQQLFARAGCAA